MVGDFAAHLQMRIFSWAIARKWKCHFTGLSCSVGFGPFGQCPRPLEDAATPPETNSLQKCCRKSSMGCFRWNLPFFVGFFRRLLLGCVSFGDFRCYFFWWSWDLCFQKLIPFSAASAAKRGWWGSKCCCRCSNISSSAQHTAPPHRYGTNPSQRLDQLFHQKNGLTPQMCKNSSQRPQKSSFSIEVVQKVCWLRKNAPFQMVGTEGQRERRWLYQLLVDNWRFFGVFAYKKWRSW